MNQQRGEKLQELHERIVDLTHRLRALDAEVRSLADEEGDGEDTVRRLVERVHTAEATGTRASNEREAAHGRAAQSVEQQRRALAALHAELETLPVTNPSDGRGGRDHDELLYAAEG